MENQAKAIRQDSPILRAIKGAIIAIGAMLPGISGGALCVIMGIYKPMMEFLGHPIKQFKEKIGFFLPVLLGFLIGALGVAKLIGSFLDSAEVPAFFLFIGLIIGTLPSLFKDAGQKGRTKGSWIALILAVVLMLAWMLPMAASGTMTRDQAIDTTVITEGEAPAEEAPEAAPAADISILMWCVCGVLWGLGIVVPGMSPSNIILFLGLAAPMYKAIGALDMRVILPMGACLVATVLLLSSAVNVCLKRWYSIFMHAIIGVVIASTISILPPVIALLDPKYTYASGITDWLIYIGCFAGGCVCAWLLGRVSKPEEAAE